MTVEVIDLKDTLESKITKLEQLDLKVDFNEEKRLIETYEEIKKHYSKLIIYSNSCDLRLKPFKDFLDFWKEYYYWITEGV